MKKAKSLVKAPGAVQPQEAVIEYGAQSVNLAQLLAEEMDGLNMTFDRIKIPSGGGLSYELPSDNPDCPDTVKEFSAVILYHHPAHSYYQSKYTGGNTPPDCSSFDGKVGVDTDGAVHVCADCQYSKFGSAEDSGGKACKQKRRLYILRAGEALPTILSLPTGSLLDFSKYISRLLSKGNKSSGIVTKFSLKKAQNAGGISYSQAVLSVDRVLTENESLVIDRLAEQVKAMASKAVVTAEAADEE